MVKIASIRKHVFCPCQSLSSYYFLWACSQFSTTLFRVPFPLPTPQGRRAQQLKTRPECWIRGLHEASTQGIEATSAIDKPPLVFKSIEIPVLETFKPLDAGTPIFNNFDCPSNTKPESSSNPFNTI